MGAAFKQVVTSFTGGIVAALIGLIFKTDLKNLKWIVKEGIVNHSGNVIEEVAALYGGFLTNLIDFIIVTFVMFIIEKV
jgi:large conductance mechanosensitive channel